MKTLPQNLRIQRHLKGWTQKQLADKLKIQQSQVSDFENGSNPSLKNLYALKEVLGCGWKDLLDTQQHEN